MILPTMLGEGVRHRGLTLLVKLLTLKFGTLDDLTSARINAASPAELERWIERILTAPHLAAVFAD